METNDDPLTALMAANPPEDVEALRAALDTFTPLMNADLPEVGAYHDAVPIREIDGFQVTADVIVPEGNGPHPVLVYLHGGGWVAGSPKSHNKLAHRFAEGGVLVFNVDYRLGPEHPFPAAFDDSVHAIRWAADVASVYGGDSARLAVGGDSAGGNLTAAAVAALADEPDAPTVSAVLLIYAALDFARMSDEVPGLDADTAGGLMEIMVGGYLGTADRERKVLDPRVSPIHVAEKLPPAHIVCGTADTLIEHAAELAEKLSAAGKPFERHDIEGMPHGFMQMEMLPPTLDCIERMRGFLRQHIG